MKVMHQWFASKPENQFNLACFENLKISGYPILIFNEFHSQEEKYKLK